MSYLLDRKLKRQKIFIYLSVFVFCAIVIYFRVPIFKTISNGMNNIFRPVLVLKENIFKNTALRKSFFQSKEDLLLENETLKTKITDLELQIAQTDLLTKENNELKEVLNRKSSRNLVLANVLLHPSRYFYDYMIIDIGEDFGIQEGERVFAFGNIPIGKVSQVFEKSSRVTLFSTSGENNQVFIKNTVFDLVGRGGGNFEIILPKDFTLEKGDKATFTDLNTNIVAIVTKVISDPRDTFTKAILRSPINFNQLDFVQVEK
jgi:cell shape-determining protein MreC